MPNENKHSVLAPSSKEWVHCGYSAKFLATKEEETNDASEFGTECHALAEAYDEDIWSYLIDKAVVNRDGSITFNFRNGKEIKIN